MEVIFKLEKNSTVQILHSLLHPFKVDREVVLFVRFHCIIDRELKLNISISLIKLISESRQNP